MFWTRGSVGVQESNGEGDDVEIQICILKTFPTYLQSIEENAHEIITALESFRRIGSRCCSSASWSDDLDLREDYAQFYEKVACCMFNVLMI